jgi:acetyltransferase-like isoleucine patch superfamily enzyme
MSKKLLWVLTMMAPNVLRRFIMRKLLKWDVSSSARLSRLSYIDVGVLTMGQGASIGAFTVIKGLRNLQLGSFGIIGRLNWISAFPEANRTMFVNTGRDPSLYVEQHAAITNRHLIDCTDAVRIGEYSTVAGFRSQLLTHSIDLKRNVQSCKPIRIGRYSFVGTACVLLGGARVPDQAIVAAGSVVIDDLPQAWALYAGTPARLIKPIDQTYKYMSREHGTVH